MEVEAQDLGNRTVRDTMKLWRKPLTKIPHQLFWFWILDWFSLRWFFFRFWISDFAWDIQDHANSGWRMKTCWTLHCVPLKQTSHPILVKRFQSLLLNDSYRRKALFVWTKGPGLHRVPLNCWDAQDPPACCDGCDRRFLIPLVHVLMTNLLQIRVNSMPWWPGEMPCLLLQGEHVLIECTPPNIYDVDPKSGSWPSWGSD